MNAALEIGFSAPDCSDGASAEQLRRLELAVGASLPADYRELLHSANGCRGWLGSDLFVGIWPAEEAACRNARLHVSEFATGAVLIGDDGGTVMLAFDSRVPDGHPARYVTFDAVVIDWDEPLRHARSLRELLERMGEA